MYSIRRYSQLLRMVRPLDFFIRPLPDDQRPRRHLSFKVFQTTSCPPSPSLLFEQPQKKRHLLSHGQQPARLSAAQRRTRNIPLDNSPPILEIHKHPVTVLAGMPTPGEMHDHVALAVVLWVRVDQPAVDNGDVLQDVRVRD